MKHDAAIKAMDDNRLVHTGNAHGYDSGRIVALGQYDTADCHDHERSHPLNKRNWALVSWESGVRTWTPIRALTE